MNPEYSQRTELLLGPDAVARLALSTVLVVGCGGVGSYVVEALARAGVGRLVIVDADTVAPSNINRQLPALVSSVGQPKVEVIASRVADINPECSVEPRAVYLTADGAGALLDEVRPDAVVDAIDSVAPKVALIEAAYRRRIRIMSSMGAGGRTDLTKIRYADISETYHDGLARAVRLQLRRRGISSGVGVVFSTEQPDRRSLTSVDGLPGKLTSFGTVAWLPAAFGLYLAAKTVGFLTADSDHQK